MRDPERLLDGESTALERGLLRAGMDEEPAAGGRERLRALLGVSAGLAVGTVGAKAAAATGARVAASKVALIVGAVGSAAAAAYMAIQVVGHRSAPVAAAYTAAPGGVAAPSSPAPELPPPTSPDALHDTRGGMPAVAGPVAPAPAAARSPASAVPERAATARSIAEEIRAIDGARRSLAEGRVGPAIAALDGYDRAHPAGMLRQEATLLRIEALVRSGDRVAARRLGERFLRGHPGSPHERRIRALVGDAAP